MNDKLRPIAALLVLLAGGAVAYYYRARLGADFLPLDASRVGPNLVAAAVQAAFVFVLLVLLYPPWRRAAHRFMDRKLDRLHEKVDALHRRHDEHAEQLERIAKRVEALHRKHDAQRRAAEKPNA